MKLINQKGFGLADVLIIVVVVGALGGVGTTVYRQQAKNKPVQKQQTITNFDECVAAGNPVMESYPEQCAANGQTFVNKKQTEKKQNNSVTSLPKKEIVELLEPPDLDNLPGITPVSFKTYLEEELTNNTPDKFGCYSFYLIEKISSLNISGRVYSAEKDRSTGTENCFGGSAVYWYLKDSRWMKLTTQMKLLCTELKKTTIFSEFIKECFSADNTGSLIPNPNGSIEDAN